MGARVLGKRRGPVPYLQGQDDTEIDGDASGC
jgi:hypothetical protein